MRTSNAHFLAESVASFCRWAFGPLIHMLQKRGAFSSTCASPKTCRALNSQLNCVHVSQALRSYPFPPVSTCLIRLPHIHAHGSTHTETDTQRQRHTDTQTHRHTDSQTHRRTDTHTQTYTHRHTQTQTDTHTHPPNL